MVSPFEDFAEGLTKLPDADAIWEHTAAFAHDLGFSGCSMTLAREVKSGLKSDYLKSDISDEFNAIYANNGLINYDPFLLFSCHSLTAKKFGVSDLSSFPSVSRQQQIFLDCTADFGATNGVGVPVRMRGMEFSVAGYSPVLNRSQPLRSWKMIMDAMCIWREFWPMSAWPALRQSPHNCLS